MCRYGAFNMSKTKIKDSGEPHAQVFLQYLLQIGISFSFVNGKYVVDLQFEV